MIRRKDTIKSVYIQSLKRYVNISKGPTTCWRYYIKVEEDSFRRSMSPFTYTTNTAESLKDAIIEAVKEYEIAELKKIKDAEELGDWDGDCR